MSGTKEICKRYVAIWFPNVWWCWQYGNCRPVSSPGLQCWQNRAQRYARSAGFSWWCTAGCTKSASEAPDVSRQSLPAEKLPSWHPGFKSRESQQWRSILPLQFQMCLHLARFSCQRFSRYIQAESCKWRPCLGTQTFASHDCFTSRHPLDQIRSAWNRFWSWHTSHYRSSSKKRRQLMQVTCMVGWTNLSWHWALDKKSNRVLTFLHFQQIWLAFCLTRT